MFNWFGKKHAAKKQEREFDKRLEQLQVDVFRAVHTVEHPAAPPFVLIKIIGFEGDQPMLVLHARESDMRLTLLTVKGEILTIEMNPDMEYSFYWNNPGINSGIDKGAHLAFLVALEDILESDPSMGGKVCMTLLGEPIDGVRNRILTPRGDWDRRGTKKLFVLGFNASAIVPLEDLDQILLDAKVTESERLKTAFKKVAYGPQLDPGDYAKFGNELVGHKPSAEAFLIVERMSPIVVGGRVFNAIGLNLKTRRYEPLYTKDMHKTGDINRLI